MRKIFELRGNGEYMDIDYVNAKLSELSDLVNDDNGFNLNYDVDNNGSFEVILTNTVSNKELCWKYTDLILTFLVDEVMDERIRITSEEEAMDFIEKGIHSEMGVSESRIHSFKKFNYSNKINESKIPNDIKDDKEFYDKLREVIKFGMDKFDADAIDVWAAIGSHIKFYGGR